MQFTFLGTSSGVPTRSRNVSGVTISRHEKNPWVLVDCGEGTQHQLMHTHYQRKSLKVICITHVHGDHCFGLPGLLASFGMGRRTEPLLIIGPQALQEFIDTALRVSESYIAYPIEFLAVEQITEPVEKAGFAIQPWPLSHRVPSFAYAFTELHVDRHLDTAKMQRLGIEAGPLWGQLQRGESVIWNGTLIQADDVCLPQRRARRIIIAGDNDTPSLLEEPSASTDVLVHEATYTQVVADKVGAGRGHSSAKVVAEFAEKMRLPNLVLTHFSSRYGDEREDIDLHRETVSLIKTEARAHYQQGQVFLAKDLQTYRLDRDSNLSLLGG